MVWIFSFDISIGHECWKTKAHINSRPERTINLKSTWHEWGDELYVGAWKWEMHTVVVKLRSATVKERANNVYCRLTAGHWQTKYVACSSILDSVELEGCESLTWKVPRTSKNFIYRCQKWWLDRKNWNGKATSRDLETQNRQKIMKIWDSE